MYSKTSSLVSVLQESISHIAEDEFHPVLYQAMASLHEYIGTHQHKLAGNHSFDPKPSFCKPTVPNKDHVVAFGWLEQMTSVNRTPRNSNNNNNHKPLSLVHWDAVLLLLVVPGSDCSKDASNMPPYLKIAQETLGTAGPRLRTLHKIPLHSKFLRWEKVDLYGDVRLVLHIGTETSGIPKGVLTLRPNHHSQDALGAWIQELQQSLENLNNTNNGMPKAPVMTVSLEEFDHPQNYSQTDSDNTNDNQDGLLEQEDHLVNQSVEVEMNQQEDHLVNQSVEVEMNHDNDAVMVYDGLDCYNEFLESNPSDEEGMFTPAQNSVDSREEAADTFATLGSESTNSKNKWKHLTVDVEDEDAVEIERLHASTPTAATANVRNIQTLTADSKQQAEEKLQELESTVVVTKQLASPQPTAASNGSATTARRTVVQEHKMRMELQHKQQQQQQQEIPLPTQQLQQVKSQEQPRDVGPEQPQEQHRMVVQPTQQAKFQHTPPHDKVHQLQQQHRQMQQQTKQADSKSSQQPPEQRPSTPTAAVTPAAIQMAKELFAEQQKKLAAERRRKEMELQRALARVEQKRKDLEGKRKFLEKEQRKQELVAKATQRPSNDISMVLKQIQKQLKEVDAEMQQQKAEAAQIKAEIESHKNQPLQASTISTPMANAPGNQADAAAQRRLAEQARRERYLEAQKKAAVEKRREELDDQRRKAREEQKKRDDLKKQRFMEQEQRKQDLMDKAKAGKTSQEDGENSALMRKLSKQLSGFDAEAEKRAEEAKNDEGQELQDDKVEDPETARMRIAEEARQRLEHEEAKHAVGSLAEQAKVTETQAAASEEGVGVWPTAWDQSQQQTPGSAEGTWGQSHQPSSSASLASMFDSTGTMPQGQTPYPATQGAMQMPPQHGPMNNSPYVYHQYRQQQQQQHQPPQQRDSPYHQPAAFNVHMSPPSSPPHLPSFQPQHSPAVHHQPSHPPTASHPRPSGASYPASPHLYPPSHRTATSTTSGPPHQRHPPSGVDQKYGKIIAQTEDDSSSTTDLKRKIIVGWGLRPDLQGLKPINELLRTIQTVFPPANDLPFHSYFDGWTPIYDAEMLDSSGTIDEKMLIKVVRKLRFFLHPDKLPRDLTDEQQFVCKLLWDMINDSWAEYEKASEELDWMN